MSYISPRQRFIEDCLNNACDLEDALFLADLEFDESGEPKPDSIYATARRADA